MYSIGMTSSMLIPETMSDCTSWSSRNQHIICSFEDWISKSWLPLPPRIGESVTKTATILLKRLILTAVMLLIASGGWVQSQVFFAKNVAKQAPRPPRVAI
jgi:hypothetical protein